MMSSRVLCILSALFLGTLLFSCAESPKEESPFRDFWVIDTTLNYNTNPAAWHLIRAEKKAETAHAVVYVDVNETQITAAIAASLAAEFDGTIFPNVTQYFAAPLDADGNGRTILLVYDIIDEYYYNHGVPSFIGGYFFSIDLYDNASVNAFNSAYGTVLKTNQADMLYIDCDPQADPLDARGTIAHEFQHLVNFSNVLKLGKAEATDSWIDEGLAEAANHLCYGALADRIDFYNSDSGGSTTNGHPLFYWDVTNPLPNYAKSYLFFQYMKAQSSSGNGIFKSIMNSSYGDYRAVRDAMTGDTALFAWDANGDTRFDLLLLRWHAVNNGVSDGDKYSYKGVLASHTPSAHLYAGLTTPVLKSGGGVVKDMNATFSNPDGEFIYMSVNNDGTGEDLTSTFAQRNKFVAVFRTYITSDPGGSGSSDLPASIDTTLDPQLSFLGAGYNLKLNSLVPQKPQMVDFVFPKGLTAGMNPMDGEDGK